MSKADEMFEKLGYKNKTEIIKNNDLITIEYDKENKYAIKFKPGTREVILDGFRGIEFPELQAINEKVKELGWNE